MGGFARVGEALGEVCRDSGVEFRFNSPVAEVSEKLLVVVVVVVVVVLLLLSWLWLLRMFLLLLVLLTLSIVVMVGMVLLLLLLFSLGARDCRDSGVEFRFNCPVV